MSEGQSSAALNTDRELWREQSQLFADSDNYYAPSIHVTASGAIGINVGGNVIVKPLLEWHSLARTVSPSPEQSGELVKRLLSVKPEVAGWWMIERDDLEFRPAYLRNSTQEWVPDWRDGTRFTRRSEAEKMAEWRHHGYSFVRSHGMMTEYHNPDGPEAADALEAAQAEIARLTEALERIAKHDVGLQGLIEDGKDTPDNVANYYAAQIKRRRDIARAALKGNQP